MQVYNISFLVRNIMNFKHVYLHEYSTNIYDHTEYLTADYDYMLGIIAKHLNYVDNDFWCIAL